MSYALVDLATNTVHAESPVIRNTTRCGRVIDGPYMRVTLAPLDMLPGGLCPLCYVTAEAS